MTWVNARVPNGYAGDRSPLTPQAVASMIGQRPKVTLNASWELVAGTATVVDAGLDHEGNVTLTLDMPEPVAEKVTGTVAAGEFSIGPARGGRAVHDLAARALSQPQSVADFGIGFVRRSGVDAVRLLSTWPLADGAVRPQEHTSSLQSPCPDWCAYSGDEDPPEHHHSLLRKR